MTAEQTDQRDLLVHVRLTTRSARDTNAGEYSVNVGEYSRSREEQTCAEAFNRHPEPSPKPSLKTEKTIAEASHKTIILLQVRVAES